MQNECANECLIPYRVLDSIARFARIRNSSSILCSLLQLCEENHPEMEYEENCIVCRYFNKGLNSIQQHDFAFAIQCIFACRNVDENGNSDNHEECNHCQRLIEKLFDNYF